MPSNRTQLNRARTPLIDAETLALFVELNAVPKRRRDNPEFRRRDLELHRRLGVSIEWKCSVVSVLDPSRKSYREGFHHEAWLKVRKVRLRLLEAAASRRRRTPPISAEMLAEFKALELTPPRRRQSAEFKRRDYELHEPRRARDAASLAGTGGNERAGVREG
jgi:hypothetical protein